MLRLLAKSQPLHQRRRLPRYMSEACSLAFLPRMVELHKAIVLAYPFGVLQAFPQVWRLFLASQHLLWGSACKFAEDSSA